jgi:hypothetical protein
LAFISVHAGAASAVVANDGTEVQNASKPTLTQELRTQLAALRNRQAAIDNAAVALRDMSKEEMPKGLPAEDRATWPKFVSFLGASHVRIAKLAERWSAKLAAYEQKLNELEASGDTTRLKAAAKEMQEMTQAFNLQYLQLQSNMQDENRQFTMVSNIMKSKHDTAKNSINNIR